MDTSKRVITHVDGHVAHVQLNRPDKLNAMDEQMFAGLIDAGEGIWEMCQQGTVRSVVLSGRGKCFSAGLDEDILLDVRNGDSAVAGRLLADYDGIHTRAQYVAAIWHKLPVPVIAALHGFVYGAGLQVALNADIRIVSPTAVLQFLEVSRGLVPDMTGIQRLRHLVSRDRAMLMILGGPRIMGAKAFEMGLATVISDDPINVSLDLAHSYAKLPEDALRASKRLLHDWDTTTVEQGIRAEARAQRELIRELVGTR